MTLLVTFFFNLAVLSARVDLPYCLSVFVFKECKNWESGNLYIIIEFKQFFNLVFPVPSFKVNLRINMGIEHCE